MRCSAKILILILEGITSDAIRKKLFFFKHVFFRIKNLAFKKKHSKSVFFVFVFLNTHLKEITS